MIEETHDQCYASVFRSNFSLKSTAFDAESDALRDELGDMNVEIIDEVGHTIWMIRDNLVSRT